jgi:hypothetical protein
MVSLRLAWPLAQIALLAALLAACGDGGAVRSPGMSPPPRAKRVPPTRPPAHNPQRRPLPAPQVQTLPGVAGVIGAGHAELVRQFGAPRLDVWEGDARKLQYSGAACVLDIYLYPPAAGAEPRASYVDARRPGDGQDADRATCIAALRRTTVPTSVTPP